MPNVRSMRASDRTALRILCCITIAELVPIVPRLAGIPFGFVGLGHALARPASLAGWVLGALVAAAYVGAALRDPLIRANARTGGALKAAGIALAVSSGITEEAFFRAMVMNAYAAAGRNVVTQIIASAVIFGLAHAVWGLLGGRRTALSAMAWTTALGAGLAFVYLAGGRALLPCVVAHAAIYLILEPALVMSALQRRRHDAPAAEAAM